MENKLRTCPFCGCGAVLVEDEGAYKVFCRSAYCDAQYGWCATAEQAISGWNRRKKSEIVRCGECKHKSFCPSKIDCGNGLLYYIDFCSNGKMAKKN